MLTQWRPLVIQKYYLQATKFNSMSLQLIKGLKNYWSDYPYLRNNQPRLSVEQLQDPNLTRGFEVCHIRLRARGFVVQTRPD